MTYCCPPPPPCCKLCGPHLSVCRIFKCISMTNFVSYHESLKKPKNCESLSFNYSRMYKNPLILTMTKWNKYQVHHATRLAPSLSLN
jgi:hypothetical protein